MVEHAQRQAGGDDEGLRERSKRRRRRRILDAARALLRESGDGEPTKEQIAERAEVAPATVYNLVGTRARLWAALADDFMDELDRRLDERPATDPVARVHQVVEATVELFVADPLVAARMVRGWEESGLVLRRGPLDHLVAALSSGQQAGLLTRQVDVELIASSIATGCVGAVHQWAAGMIGADRFRSRAMLAADIALAAAAADGERERLLRSLRRRRPRKDNAR